MRGEEWLVSHPFFYHREVYMSQRLKNIYNNYGILFPDERGCLIFMKNSVIFIVIALSLFALFLSAAAQTELPAIDEAEAAPFLGRWYMNSACGADDTCVNMADIGISINL